MLSKKVVTLY